MQGASFYGRAKGFNLRKVTISNVRGSKTQSHPLANGNVHRQPGCLPSEQKGSEKLRGHGRAKPPRAGSEDGEAAPFPYPLY